MPPSALGSAWDRRAKKWAEPAEFGVLGGAPGVFFWRRRKKWRLGGLLGVRLEMLLARDLQKGTSQARKQNYEVEQMN